MKEKEIDLFFANAEIVHFVHENEVLSGNFVKFPAADFKWTGSDRFCADFAKCIFSSSSGW